MTERETKRIWESYLETAIWSSGEEYDEYCLIDFSDGAKEYSENIVDDFVAHNEHLLDQLMEEGLTNPDRIGHNLWLTQAGHGAGFWDDNLGVTGDLLTEWAKSWRTESVYLNGEGQLEIC